MSPYTWLVGNVLFPLHEKVKGHTTLQVHKQLEQSQWLPPAELKALQISRLRSFLCDIGEHVPYYRDLFESLAFAPRAFSCVADLQKLPLMGKPDIRANMDSMTASDAGDLQRFNTGGSSGEPLVFLLGKERVSHDVAAKRRATRWWGVDIGDPEIVIWGSPIELNAQDRLRLTRDKLFRTRLLSAFEMSDKNLDRFAQEIRRNKPKMLFGYPSSLAHIAAHAHARGIKLDDLGIRVAFVTSERLYDHQREQIELSFGCRVANGYGGRDAGFIAHACPEGSLHITAEDIIVEIIRPDGTIAAAGESGEIVTTHMATRDFPFVRYRTGDVGAIDDTPCGCGRGLPVLKELQGRTTDFVVAADGTVMHGLSLIYVLRELQGIKEFKIVQESLDYMRVIIVPDEQWHNSIKSVIVHGFKARLGADVKVDVDLQSEIEAEASGKRRYVISRVLPEISASRGSFDD